MPLPYNTGASSRFMGKVTNFIRSNAGRKSVPAYYRDQAAAKSKLMGDLYHHKVAKFDVEGKYEKQERPVV